MPWFLSHVSTNLSYTAFWQIIINWAKRFDFSISAMKLDKESSQSSGLAFQMKSVKTQTGLRFDPSFHNLFLFYFMKYSIFHLWQNQVMDFFLLFRIPAVCHTLKSKKNRIYTCLLDYLFQYVATALSRNCYIYKEK